MLLGCAALAVAGLIIGANYVDGLEVGGSDSARATEVLADTYPERLGISARAVFWTEGIDITTDAPRRLVQTALAEIAQLPDVESVDDPYVTGAMSPDRFAVIADIRLGAGVEPTTAVLDAISEPTTRAMPVRAAVGGPLADATSDPEAGSEIVGVAVALVVLTLVLGSIAAAAIPLGAAFVALSAGLGAVALATNVIDVPSLAPQLALMIGLGVGIDDALLVVARYREERQRGATHGDSVAITASRSGRSIAIAGLTTVVSIMGLALVGIGALTAMGIATSVVVAVTVAVNVTVLPAVLARWGEKIRLRRSAPSRVLTAWSGWALRHRVAAMTLGIGLLVAMALPALGLDLSYVTDSATAAPDSPQRVTYDRITAEFGEGHNADLVAVVDLRRVPLAERGDVATAMARLIGSDAGVARVLPPEFAGGAAAATIGWFPSDAPSTPEADATIRRLRALDVERSIDGGEGLAAHVWGSTASRADFSSRIAERLWWFVSAVVAVSLLVLTAVFRAPVVALKAAFLNLLAVAASYGVVVAVFQWGWGASLIGVDRTLDIDPFVPVFLFAILFGLSVDYEVFLIERIREHHRVHHDNDAAIRHAIGATGTVIGSAALIMIAIFAGFIAGNEVVTKMFGVGLMSAVALDVTVIRTFVLPATMSLLGDANWWWPFSSTADPESPTTNEGGADRAEAGWSA